MLSRRKRLVQKTSMFCLCGNGGPPRGGSKGGDTTAPLPMESWPRGPQILLRGSTPCSRARKIFMWTVCAAKRGDGPPRGRAGGRRRNWPSANGFSAPAHNGHPPPLSLSTCTAGVSPGAALGCPGGREPPSPGRHSRLCRRCPCCQCCYCWQVGTTFAQLPVLSLLHRGHRRRHHVVPLRAAAFWLECEWLRERGKGPYSGVRSARTAPVVA